MALSNTIIKAPIKNKPHIVKIEGYWRVSPRGSTVPYSYKWMIWKSAHEWASDHNEFIASREH